MRITCPFCGSRDIQEFVCRGEAQPAPSDAAEDFYSYLYERDNPVGFTREHWYHAQGCRNWLLVERDTLTHTVQSARLAGETQP